jgi:hypothetical protein
MSAIRIGVVGPCAAGKTTLLKGLHDAGFTAKHIAQEHSGVKDMWERLTNPDVLIYLDVSYPFTIQRRKLNWTLAEYEEQHFRLRHAHENADLYIQTDNLTPGEVLEKVMKFIELNLATK